ncbi:HAD hydrolase, REG-2-like, family IA [Oesophagostomum dentatum]|uniref:HAD hydrolase, REG-2-like, family IA n=1 Tax=Oesophagostomum dentatum TaxID=61180 RepID=A0A0B1TAS6_OESDE|nr:HAD hydrolase, REG-2-like, family IA [Oesophagostomum dentatum]
MASVRRLPMILRPLRKACSTFTSTSSTAREVQVVSFDVNDTLISEGEPFNEVYSRVASDNGVDVNPDSIANSYPKYMKDLSDKHPCFGFSSIGDFEWWKRIVVGCLQEGCSTKINRDTANEIAHDLYDFYATAKAWKLIDPKLKSVLENLRKKGVGLVVVSNFDARVRSVLQEFGLYDLFDVIVASGEIGVEKPSPKIFEKVQEHFQLSNASQMLHIGDNVEKDYRAALDFGANALLFDPLCINAEVSPADKISSISELRVD